MREACYNFVMKLIPLLVAFLMVPTAHAAEPYVQGLWTKSNPVYVTTGETFTPSKLAPDATVTTIALAYHPLAAGSFWDLAAVAAREPAWIQPYLPRESWACSIGGSWNSAAKAGVFGCGLNLLDTVRQEASQALQDTGNSSLAALGAQIAPGKGPVSLYASRVEQNSADRPFVFVPRWMFAASYGF